jgi:rubredoxin
MTVYDEGLGDMENGIVAGTSFDLLPSAYCCPLCDAPKKDFAKIPEGQLGLQAV